MTSRTSARLRDTLEDASSDLEEQLEDIREDLGTLRDVLGDVLSKSGSIVSSQVATAREAVKGKAGSWLKSGQDVAEQTLERAREGEADFEEVVQLHPMIAVAAAVGIGLVIGAILTSGSRR